MKYRPQWALLALGALIVVFLFTYPTWRLLLRGRSQAPAFQLASDDQRDILQKMRKDLAGTAYVAMLTVVPAPTNEQPTPVLPDAQVIEGGTFAGLNSVQTTAGKVVLYRSADGSLLLRFDEFKTTNAPGLVVYLCGTAEVKAKEDLPKGALEVKLGPLKGSAGNQQYTTIPKDLPLDRYKSVVIYSDSLELVYGVAPLAPLR